ncbi:glycosyltransferase [Paraburkholderia nemoris]|uniref:glycosyltransferase n=1 Tax=Paraburkholderia nemoris TaxID=2793076 RepID=UPI0038BBE2D1
MKNEKIVIYRNQLFKSSEPFIALQARNLPNFQPIFVGREMYSEPDEGVETIDLHRSSKFSKFLHAVTAKSRKINREIDKKRPLLVHAHFGVDGVYGAKVAMFLKVPLIVTLHGFDVTVDRKRLLTSPSPALVRYGVLRKKLASDAARFICVSNFIREKAIEYGFPEEKLVTHYIGVDLEKFRTIKRAAHAKFRVLHVARLVEKKGTRYLIEAFRMLERSKLPHFHLDIVGDGPMRPDLEAWVALHGLHKSITFHGVKSQDEVLNLLEKSDVLCQPSITAENGDAEGLGMVLLEAAACGLPVVATFHGGIPEVVLDGETGILIQERDATAIYKALILLRSDKAYCRRMGENARKRAETQFDVARQCIELEKIYADVLGRK